MNQTSSRALALTPFALVLVFGATMASAQTISTTVATTANGETVDLQANGPTDWVQFGVNGSSAGFSLFNEKSGGSVGGLDTIGALAESNDLGGAGRTESTQNIFVSYGNGTSPISSATYSAGNINAQTGYAGGDNSESNDAVLSFTIDFNQAISNGTITLAGDDFATTLATLTATLSNGNTVTTDTGGAPNTGEQNEIFTINLSNITAGSSLTLSQELVTGDIFYDNGGYDNIAFNGVALDLTEAPEPATWATMMLGAAGLIVLARRKRALAS